MDRLLKIAAVDDLQSEREQLAEKIKDYMEARWLKYELFQYENGEAFVAALETERFDIVFMDIFMGELNGITCSGKLRERDMDCKLVFLTTSKDFMADGYTYNPCHYLVKPFDQDKFEQAMENCRIKRQVEVPYLDVVSDGAPLRIDTTQLMYITTGERTVFLHTAAITVQAGRSFSAITEPLTKDARFLQSLQGVLVNMDFVSSVEDTVFVMKDGARLPMAVRTRKNLIKQYQSYQFECASSWGRNCL